MPIEEYPRELYLPVTTITTQNANKKFRNNKVPRLIIASAVCRKIPAQTSDNSIAENIYLLLS